LTKVFISLGLQEIKSCLRGKLERYDLATTHDLEFVQEVELADIVLTEVNSIYRFAGTPTVALTDNESIIDEYENVVNIAMFPTSANDLPVIHRALVKCFQ